MKATKTLLEEFVAQLNANTFFAEFAFSSTEVKVPGEGQAELADHLVLVDGWGLIFQLKERDPSASSAAPELDAWFKNKVLKKAVRQVRSTKEMLHRFRGSRLRNQRGHEVPVAPADPDALVAIIIYRAPELLPSASKYVDSQSAGFVHIISDVDYFGVCQFLITPAEILDYFAFRETVLKTYPSASTAVSEAALVGHYIGGDVTEPPSSRFESVLTALREDTSEWDLSFFTENLGNQIAYREGDTSETSHYRILTEFAKLSRSELRELKKRLVLALEAVREDRPALPYRMACPRIGCGFLIVPLTADLHDKARRALENFSVASKYEFQVQRHVSLSIVRRSPYFDIEWMYIDGPNVPDPELENLLERNYPFRTASEKMMPRYYLDSDALRKLRGGG